MCYHIEAESGSAEEELTGTSGNRYNSGVYPHLTAYSMSLKSGAFTNESFNIFVKPEGPVFGMDDRGKGRNYATNKKLLNGVNSINPSILPWSDEFPEMPTFLDNHPELPQRTKFVGNLIWIKSGESTLLKMSKENKTNNNLLKMDQNFVTNTDPGFVDPVLGNFNLKKESQVFQKIFDFPKIEFDKIGLYIDKYRKALPSPADAGRLKEQNPWKEDDMQNSFGT